MANIRLYCQDSLHSFLLVILDKILLISNYQIKSLQNLLYPNPLIPINFQHFPQEGNKLIAEIELRHDALESLLGIFEFFLYAGLFIILDVLLGE